MALHEQENVGKGDLEIVDYQTSHRAIFPRGAGLPLPPEADAAACASKRHRTAADRVLGVKREWDPNRWVFTVGEVSNLCWEAVADDQQGTVIRRQRWETDRAPEALLQEVKDEAAEITRRRREAASSD